MYLIGNSNKSDNSIQPNSDTNFRNVDVCGIIIFICIICPNLPQEKVEWLCQMISRKIENDLFSITANLKKTPKLKNTEKQEFRKLKKMRV